ncbi:hypothetical protein [uncultured Bifidobacterium sp.]|uniref:endonuclease domain-containing protein n=1 Tax=uncultured Bifidobacterium sp. TaxID=165187 RepID=UPI002614218F|nr:hypothetical protein [uncultured Bifidobacterium sp.]
MISAATATFRAASSAHTSNTTHTTGFFTLDKARELATLRHRDCRQRALRTSRHLTFSHTTLLELHGMTLRLTTRLNPHLLHVTVPHMKEKSHLVGVDEHLWTGPMSTQRLDELFSGVSVEQAVCQISQYTDVESLTMVMDWLTCANKDLRQSSHHKLREAIMSYGRFPGRRRCLTALSHSVEGTDSPQETLLRLALTNAGLPCPSVNHPIIDMVSQKEWKVDMAFEAHHVAIEYDGEYHYDHRRWTTDIHKRNRLQDLGWTVLVAVKGDLNSRNSLREFTMMVARALLDHSRR